ncbi:hypothetical protein [Alicyclobacillus shizuokensis]|uniref:hypothetical protein n=1 Tax=Alicyclobacillus shizuokensis TaxID=392014 RepID=UPI0008362526|nr:hypothetical protein [Alicyclobacillus shizuokensis]MCL6626075.1 hypothetical protein [Alicyclobacillus shizuokensis]
MADDERNKSRRWLRGIIHYDPENRKTFVRRTMGFGFTINFATPFGKVLGIVMILVIIAIVVLKYR